MREFRRLKAGLAAAISLVGLTISQLTGCTTAGAVAAGAAGAAAVGAFTPAQEIEQVYYLGVFDPIEQVPATVYRVTVHGQASAISGLRFASGWFPSHLIDSLSSRVEIEPDGAVRSSQTQPQSSIRPGRRLVMFGPEGFRDAPADHRLVVLMGQSPEKFLSAINRVAGSASPPDPQSAAQQTALRARMNDRIADLKREIALVDAESPHDSASPATTGAQP